MALINFRTYVHKKTGTTTKVKEGYTQVEIPRELIENSSDRELVEERDWISDVIDFYGMIAKADDREDTKKYLRIAIEKYMHKCSCNCK